MSIGAPESSQKSYKRSKIILFYKIDINLLILILSCTRVMAGSKTLQTKVVALPYYGTLVCLVHPVLTYYLHFRLHPVRHRQHHVREERSPQNPPDPRRCVIPCHLPALSQPRRPRRQERWRRRRDGDEIRQKVKPPRVLKVRSMRSVRDQ